MGFIITHLICLGLGAFFYAMCNGDIEKLAKSLE